MEYLGDAGVCCIKGCDKASVAMNLCGAHWRRNRLYGGPVASKSSRHLFRGKTAPERFEMQVVRSAGCWSWRGGKDQDGYPIFHGELDGVVYKRGHRYSYVASTGEHPGDLQVLHSCDNPECSNPDHLSLGTNAENMADKIAKGRHRARRGADHGNAKITEEQAKAILADPRGYAVIADELGVSYGLVSDIKNRQSWRHLEAVAVKGRHRGEGRRGKSDKITPEIVREIRTSTESGKTLAERYGISPQSITDIRKGRSWRHVT